MNANMFAKLTLVLSSKFFAIFLIAAWSVLMLFDLFNARWLIAWLEFIIVSMLAFDFMKENI